MNEGKPTKAKWWSRPRSSDDATDGDFELQRPRAARSTATGEEAADGGDFELDSPAPVAAGTGDYELDRPTADGAAADAGSPADASPRAATAPHAGPRRTGAENTGVRTPGDDGTGVRTGSEGDGTGVRRDTDGDAAAQAGRTDAVPPVAADAALPTGTDGDARPAGDLEGAASVAERPGPLHDPDPYSTPPYGEPGPWAPAPPVQHPATTSAHGTVAAASHSGDVPVAPPPGALPDPAFADTPPPAQPAPGVPVAPPASAPAPAVPSPAQLPGTAPGPAFADAPVAAPAAAGTGGDGTDADPWRRYDPWAASAAASLQQSGAAVPTRDQRRRRARKVVVGGALIIALVSGGIGGALGTYLERNGGIGTVELPQAGKEAAERAPDSVAGIAARALPSVVTLHVSGGDAAGTGTGFVLDDRGHILTNNHVVEPAGSGGEITVTFNSGDTAEATVVGRDGGYDLAVVKVKGVSGLTPMPLGNSDNVRVGDPVVAIGAPFDLAGTVTSGIISAKERPITAGGEEGDGSDVSYVDALQTDAPINPGNSGGPLLDAQGRAIGINSAIRSADGGGTESDGGQSGSIGLGFAIPINQGKRVAEELINTGRATHPVIGITLDMAYSGDGARVAAKGSAGGPPVTTGGPGAEAGIRAGDVITAVDGKRVHSGEELIVRTRAHRPGDRLDLTLERDGKETHVSLVLGSSDGD
ncbi:trypsin-like peptidase domain-containing protein [Streptomyces mutabilis]|uniref:Protease n=1 Tax=Streptomyces mutabilis TaxID=67332 RepID=A0A086MY90_9ACTN|nr:trypsin-like peptidase domain-containing protein [Streptomyces mutabilis]KFG73858.1 protease [Streptomyces mutabilis]